MFHRAIVIAIIVVVCIRLALEIIIRLTHVPKPGRSVSQRPLAPGDIVKRLNTVWSRDPRRFRDDRRGFEECMVFMHSFDGVTSEGCAGLWRGFCDAKCQFPWCPRSYGDLSKHASRIPLRVPLQSVSFSAFNKHILPPDGEVIYDGDNAIGLVFDLGDQADRRISPLCFYPTDAATFLRGDCGCGGIGVQWKRLHHSSDGYDKSTAGHLFSTSSNAFRSTRNAIRHMNLIDFAMQQSLNFAQFLNVSIASRHIVVRDHVASRLNEVVFPNWNGVEFDAVPLVAFFHHVRCTKDRRLKIARVARKFAKITGHTVPLVSFDPRCGTDTPFVIA